VPLARYFLFVGGVLLALLMILDPFPPRSPVADRANVNLPVIHIHSDRKWPERVVYDTGFPTIVPAQAANQEATVPDAATTADVAARRREREAFAQMRTPEPHQLQPSDPKRREQKLQRQSKVAKRRAAPPMVQMARQTQFGWFRNGIW
jgi:hypothetical protein